MTTVYLTSASSSPWTLPGDWPGSGQIECIGAGGGGNDGVGGVGGGGGGGGGAYAKTNSVTIGSNPSFQVGVGGLNGPAGGNGTDTWLSNTGSAPTSTSEGCLADAGNGGTVGTTSKGGAGGTTAASIGDT